MSSITFRAVRLRESIIERLRRKRLQSRLWPAVPLGELYRLVTSAEPDISIGQFHDCLRELLAAGKIRLSPFTQALYQLDDGECCLILGHEIMAYAELAAGIAA